MKEKTKKTLNQLLLLLLFFLPDVISTGVAGAPSTQYVSTAKKRPLASLLRSGIIDSDLKVLIQNTNKTVFCQEAPLY